MRPAGLRFRFWQPEIAVGAEPVAAVSAATDTAAAAAADTAADTAAATAAAAESILAPELPAARQWLHPALPRPLVFWMVVLCVATLLKKLMKPKGIPARKLNDLGVCPFPFIFFFTTRSRASESIRAS